MGVFEKFSYLQAWSFLEIIIKWFNRWVIKKTIIKQLIVTIIFLLIQDASEIVYFF